MAYRDNRIGELDLSWQPEQLIADMQAGLFPEGLFDTSELEAIIESVKTPEFKEYDESIADNVEFIECPHCGQKFPK